MDRHGREKKKTLAPIEPSSSTLGLMVRFNGAGGSRVPAECSREGPCNALANFDDYSPHENHTHLEFGCKVKKPVLVDPPDGCLEEYTLGDLTTP